MDTCPANGACIHYPTDGYRHHEGCRGHEESFVGDERPWPCTSLDTRIDGFCSVHRPMTPNYPCALCGQPITEHGYGDHYRAHHPDEVAAYEGRTR